MRISGLLNSFRARLLLLLAVMLGLTLGVQYYVNLRAIQSNARVIVEQEQAIMAGVALGVNSIFSTKYLDELRSNMRVPLLDEQDGRVKNVMVVDSDGKVQDSLVSDYAPTENEDKSVRYVDIKDVPLPPLSSAVGLADERENLPSWITASPPTKPGDPGAFYFPLETTKGRRYVIVVLGSANTLTDILQRQASRSAFYTLLLLLATTLVTGLFVWRFTRPIKLLSAAAQKVARGDFSVRVPEERRDELGQFAAAFNEMTMQLARARELEAQLHEAEKGAVVGRLAAAIAHEIRNPLNYINLTLDHLRSSFAPADSNKKSTFIQLTEQLKTEVARINRHITDFLKYSRPSKLELQDVDIREEAEDALRLVEVRASECGIKTDIIQDGSLPIVLADRESLRSVFTNLIINAMEAMDGEGGRVSIKFSNTGENSVKVEISDTGRGI